MSISPGAVPTMTAIFAQCPPLPNISNPALLDRVFTHRSLTAQPANVFEDLPSSPSQHNEALEHLGDSVLNLYSTLLIQHLYPLLHVGPSSRIRSMVVANTHLARFTQFYQLHFQLRGNAAQQLNIQASLPIHADLFEAYLGALYMDQGPEVAKSWLWAVLTPSVQLAYEIVRHSFYPSIPPSAQATTVFQPETAVAGAPPPMLSPPLPVSDTAGCTSLLNQYYAQRHQYLDWEFDPPGGSISAPIWTAKAIVREEGELARATSNTKKAAKNMAAKTALVKLGLLQDGTGVSTPHMGPGGA